MLNKRPSRLHLEGMLALCEARNNEEGASMDLEEAPGAALQSEESLPVPPVTVNWSQLQANALTKEIKYTWEVLKEYIIQCVKEMKYVCNTPPHTYLIKGKDIMELHFHLLDKFQLKVPPFFISEVIIPPKASTVEGSSLLGWEPPSAEDELKFRLRHRGMPPYFGVYQEEPGGKFRSRIKLKSGVVKCLGFYDSAEQAARAFDKERYTGCMWDNQTANKRKTKVGSVANDPKKTKEDKTKSR
jgi:hypothetical protein